MKPKQVIIKPGESDNSGNGEPQAGYMVKSQIANLIQKDERTVERYMREGIIPYIKLGKGRRATVLFSWPAIQEHFAARFGVSASRHSKHSSN